MVAVLVVNVAGCKLGHGVVRFFVIVMNNRFVLGM